MSVWAEIDSNALTANARAVAAMLGERCRLCAVVKANGYGHGAVIAARAFLAGGASWLAVTTVDEAAELRAAGIDAPILLLASHLPEQAPAVVELGLTATVSDLAAARALSDAAGRRPVAVHLLIDVGMGRDGCLPGAAPALWRELHALDGLRPEGAFCHFPAAMQRDKVPTRRQLDAFLQVAARLAPKPALVHAANSAAAVDVPESRLALARVGTLLYGQYPSPHTTRALELQNAWRLCARLVEVRELPAGATIGYGSECRLARPTRVGTLLCGWQHGFTLLPESLARGLRGAVGALRRDAPHVLIAGRRCPVLGRIAMQSCTVDLSEAPQAEVGDVVEVPARRVTVPASVPRRERRS